MLKAIASSKTIFVFLLTFCFAKAQVPKIDSLKKALLGKKDTAAINCMNAIAKEYIAVSKDSFMVYTGKAYEKAESINYTKGCMRSQMMRAGYFRRLGKVDTAMVLYSSILNTSTQSGLLLEAGEAEMFMGFILQNQGEYDKSVSHFIAAEKNFEKTGNSLLLGRNNWMLGNAYLKLKSYNEASNSFEKGKKYFGEAKDSLGYFDCVLNGSIIHIDKKEYEKALDLIFTSEKFYRRVKHQAALSAALNNKSDVLVELARFDEAELALKEALIIKKELGAPLGISISLLNLGGLYHKKKDYLSAERSYNESIDMARKDNSQEIEMKAYKGLYELSKDKGDASASLEYLEKYTSLHDSIYNSEKNRIIEEMKTKYETERKDKELFQKDAEIEKKKNQQVILFGGLALVLVFSGFIYNRFKVTKRQKVIIEKQKHLVEEKQKEILDSIHYAKRIQKSLLPNETFLSKNIKRLKGD